MLDLVMIRYQQYRLISFPTHLNGSQGATVKVELELNGDADDDVIFRQISMDSKKRTATVSLNDCLACSGCVTSAETVLITEQSSGEFYKNVKDADLENVVTISPQALTALAASFELSLVDMARKLTGFLQSLGVKYVMDATCALDISLIEAREEFVQRLASSSSSSSPSNATASSSSPAGPLPVLSSECPGWICYAEKTQGEFILPYISSTRSPQQVMGTVVKQMMSKDMDKTPSQIYHTAIMPCFDKKLEGSRDDFYDADNDTRDVNLVLTTKELQDMLQEDHGITPANIRDKVKDGTLDEWCWALARPKQKHNDRGDSKTKSQSADDTNDNNDTGGENKDHKGHGAGDGDGVRLVSARDKGASGGYAENLFRYTAKQVYRVNLDNPTNPNIVHCATDGSGANSVAGEGDGGLASRVVTVNGKPLTSGKLKYKKVRNNDLREVSLEIDGVRVLHFCLAYGFRNIQNLVRKIKRDKCSYQYIEVMACPSGCLNGGGQPRANTLTEQKQSLKQMDKAFHSERLVREPEESGFVQKVYGHYLQDAAPYSEAAKQAFHTQYHAIKSTADTNPLAIKW